ncbi:hypothetical protein OZX69_03695 [Lactobacillus sp. ESL0731]|uniref:hypothetical protein n=1 Tax=unclassified Lactobacillus TaxID=2620435 RepID=UPI0023F63BBB|nr:MULTISPECIES: hypothetical protein [unclassified Lactobacillus]WEV51813.1 hypothetical protein OZX63_03695 [Lactobacillus sp. ESL0700]WEV62942.1 hypothetical protein OZX69_03695 [Lactobacillus sp. ESL0731]
MKNVVIGEYLRNDPTKEVDIAKVSQKLTTSVGRYQIETDILVNFKNEQELPPLVKTIECQPFAHYPHQGLKFYFARWEFAYEYLLRHPEIDQAALVDVGDVEMMNYPFKDIKDNVLYIGDEYNDLNTYIIEDDGKPDYLTDFTRKNKYVQLLNAGILVGTRATLLEFLSIFMKLYTDDTAQEYLGQGSTHFGIFEMAIVNYIAYTFFEGRICHGRKVASRFMYADRNVGSWFKHK